MHHSPRHLLTVSLLLTIVLLASCASVPLPIPPPVVASCQAWPELPAHLQEPAQAADSTTEIADASLQLLDAWQPLGSGVNTMPAKFPISNVGTQNNVPTPPPR